jgi:hypothetical protein
MLYIRSLYPPFMLSIYWVVKSILVLPHIWQGCYSTCLARSHPTFSSVSILSQPLVFLCQVKRMVSKLFRYLFLSVPNNPGY